MRDAVVIGGGISGLCAAYAIAKAGQSVALIEPAQSGGVIRSSQFGGFTLEHGPNVLLEKEDLRNLINELGLRSSVVYPVVDRYKRYIWWQGRQHTIPAGPSGFIVSKLVSHTAKPGIFFRLLRSGVLTPSGGDESVRIFMERLLGERGTRTLVEPALRGIFGGDIDKLSARSLFSELWSHVVHGGSLLSYVRRKERNRIFVLRGGNQQLVNALAQSLAHRVELLRQHVIAVRSVAPHNFEIQLNDGALIRARHVVVATSGVHSAKYLSTLSPGLSEELSRMRYAALAVVHCAAPRSCGIPRDAFGLLFPGGMTANILGIMYNSALFPHVAPSAKHLFTVCFGGVDAQEVCGLSDQDLQSAAASELAEKLSLNDIEQLTVRRWRFAIPQYELNHHHLLEALHDAEEAYPGLIFCGADNGGVGVADRVRVAFKRSKEVIAQCSVKHSDVMAAGTR